MGGSRSQPISPRKVRAGDPSGSRAFPSSAPLHKLPQDLLQQRQQGVQWQQQGGAGAPPEGGPSSYGDRSSRNSYEVGREPSARHFT